MKDQKGGFIMRVIGSVNGSFIGDFIEGLDPRYGKV